MGPDTIDISKGARKKIKISSRLFYCDWSYTRRCEYTLLYVESSHSFSYPVRDGVKRCEDGWNEMAMMLHIALRCTFFLLRCLIVRFACAHLRNNKKKQEKTHRSAVQCATSSNLLVEKINSFGLCHGVRADRICGKSNWARHWTGEHVWISID